MIKRVSVDRYTHEFNEEGFESQRKRQLHGVGEVRKYVHDLREKQRKMKINSRQKIPNSARKEEFEKM